MTKEVWKFYKETYCHRYGHRIYEVSSYGRVKCNGELFTCIIHKSQGYYYLCHKPLHRIVAELFLPDWDPKKQVDHKDTNRLNNRVDNLQMCTCKENHNNPITLQNLKGKHHSEETKKKLSEIHIGKHLSEEAKIKIGKSSKIRALYRNRDEKGRFC